MAEMTAQTAIDFLKRHDYNTTTCHEIASLIAAQAAEIAKQQRMVRRACEELAVRPQCPNVDCVDPEKYKAWKDCEECWLKWLEQAEEVGEK